eukprot:jgi/Bigna1/76559/fgenesh1_pg.42_\
MASTLKYPKTEKKVVVDEYHGIKVEDPYRWLEDPDSEATQAWVKEQVGLTDGYFEKECKIRAEITARQMEMQNYEKFGIPFKRGKHYFFFRNDGLQNHYVWSSVIVVLYKQSSLDGEASALLDPNKFSKDGTASLGVTKFSDNAELVAYGVKRSGSDWTTIKVRRVSDCEDFKDELSWCLIVVVASSDVLPAFLDTQRLKLLQGKMIRISREGPLKNVVKVIDNFDALYEYIHNVGDEYWFRTNKEAPCYKIVKFDINYALILIGEIGRSSCSWVDLVGVRADDLVAWQSESKDWVTVVPEKELVVLEDATVANGSFLVTQHLEHVKNKITLLDLDGKLIKDKFEMPEVASLSISAHHKQTEIFYKFTSFLYPGTVMHYDIESGKTTKFKETIVKGFKPEDYVATQAFFESKDKTKVPMFIVHKKAIDPKNPKGEDLSASNDYSALSMHVIVMKDEDDDDDDGPHPTLMYGYGGFNISLTPSFSISRLVWMQHFNGIYAVPNLRGGGDKDEFEALRAISPCHNVQEGVQYPAVLVTTADHDDRVSPLHSYKFISALQDKAGKDNKQPLLIRIEVKAGHGGGKPLSKQIEEISDVYAFMARNIGAKWQK